MVDSDMNKAIGGAAGWQVTNGKKGVKSGFKCIYWL